ncbi:type I signal peptidase SipY [Listeria costaricensis]|uniref:type I signal peptidase SipY n=1 Tax=Listeria costaricensis TaxID=2026604 RepID=UPI000C07E306|nr:type I signal peptidase SipY [Listeria costaricensis]
MAKKKEKPKTKKQQFFSWVLVIVSALLIALLVRAFIFAPVKVDGESMMPTYHDGQRLFIEKVTKPDRYDKIVFDAPEELGNTDGSYFIKRVIGLPGDEIAFKNGELYVNGKRHDETYLADGMKTYSQPGSGDGDFTLEDITGQVTVPEGKLFVLGDNRENSTDSRIFGFIDESDVDGVVISFSDDN